MIIPFEGQGKPQDQLTKEVAQANPVQVEEVKTEVKETVSAETQSKFVREEPQKIKKLSKPKGKLFTGNVGIKSTLNPVKKEEDLHDEENFTPTNKEAFNFGDLERLWKEYALKLKREKRDLLHSTLTSSELSMTSDYKITLILDNSIQSLELEREKSSLIGFLRTRLKNDFLSFDYKITESTKITVMDSKSNFEKLAEENKSLHKFRKLFSLDVEF